MNRLFAKKLWFHILIASITVAIAAFLRYSFQEELGNNVPFITFYPAIMLMATYGGFWIGLFSTFLSAIIVYFHDIGVIDLVHYKRAYIGLMAFILNGIFFAIIGEVYIRTRKRMRKALSKEHNLSNALDNISAYVYMKDLNHRYTYANKSTLEYFKCTNEDLKFKSDYDFFPKDTVLFLHNIDNQVFSSGIQTHEEIKNINHQGITEYFLEVKTPIYDFYDHDKIVGLCGISTDITDRKQKELKLQESEKRFRMLFNNAAIGMALVNLDGYFVQSNPALCKLLGYSATELSTLRFQDITHPDDLEKDLAYVKELLSNKRDAYQMEKRYYKKDGSLIWIFLAGAAVRDDEQRVLYFIAQIMDITLQKEMIQQLQTQARYDALTKLYNRRYFFEMAEHEVKRHIRMKHSLALLMIDLDHFKLINDQFGHHNGDLVLQDFAERIRCGLRSIDIIGRIGGEEFAVILPEVSQADAKAAAERLRISIERVPCMISNGQSVSYQISIGFVMLSPEVKTLEALLHKADSALYKAKSEGRNRICEG